MGTDNLVSDVGTAGDGVVISQVVPFPDDNDLPIQRECREALAASGGGKLGFVANNHQALSDVFLTQIQGGKITKLR